MDYSESPARTKESILALEPGTFFRTWLMLIRHPRWDSRNSNKIVTADENWNTVVNCVAVKWWWPDFAIYHSLHSNLEPSDYLDWTNHLWYTWEIIASHGAKLEKDDDIMEFIKSGTDVLEIYRS